MLIALSLSVVSSGRSPSSGVTHDGSSSMIVGENILVVMILIQILIEVQNSMLNKCFQAHCRLLIKSRKARLILVRNTQTEMYTDISITILKNTNKHRLPSDKLKSLVKKTDIYKYNIQKHKNHLPSSCKVQFHRCRSFCQCSLKSQHWTLETSLNARLIIGFIMEAHWIY